MELGERDPVTGRRTTGHEWNGIKELDTPIPRVVLLFLVVTTLFAVIWWILLPAWPIGSTYTKGLLGIDQRQLVAEKIQQAKTERADWVSRVETQDWMQIKADEQLVDIVSGTGSRLFADNCAVCHGPGGEGGPGYPALSDGSWLWGGDPESIAETIRVGINSGSEQTRFAQMPAFGRDQMLDRNQVSAVARYVHSLSNPTDASADRERIEAGSRIFAESCAACHGDDATGSIEMGAPDLTDDSWIYGGDIQSIVSSINGGRQGHMPHWQDRLTPAEIKILTLYVHSLGEARP